MWAELKTIIPGDGSYIDPLTGLKWLVIGDSLSDPNYLPGSQSTNPKLYWQWIQERTGILPTANAIAGTTLVNPNDGRTNGMVQRYTNITGSYDVITILGGTNDAFGVKPIGSINDSVDTSVYGACNILFKGLLEKFEGARLGFITPFNHGGVPSTYIDALKTACNKWSVPVCDLYNGGNGISPLLANFRTTYTPDGTHPNSFGHQVYSRKIETFLRSL